MEETAALNIQIERLITIGCDNRFQSDILRRKTIIVFVEQIFKAAPGHSL